MELNFAGRRVLVTGAGQGKKLAQASYSCKIIKVGVKD